MAFDTLGWLHSRIPGGRVGGSGWYNVRCPFHQDGHPSFGVNLQTGRWKCKSASCGKSSREIARLVMLIDGVTWQEACRVVDRPDPFDADDEHLGASRPSRPTVNPFPDRLVDVSGARFPTYLRERGYCLQDALAFGLHFGDDAAGLHRGYLVFPYWSLAGDYVTYAARRMSDNDGHGPRYRNPEQGVAARHLYGAWRFRGVAWAERIFAVEGQFDTMRLWGFEQVAGGLSTSAASPAQIDQLATLSTMYNAPVCVLFDNGPDGLPRAEEREKAEAVVAELDARLVPAYVGQLPDGVKDPDQLTGESIVKLLDTCKRAELQFQELE